jgi:hypothetical protein
MLADLPDIKAFLYDVVAPLQAAMKLTDQARIHPYREEIPILIFHMFVLF